MISFKNTHSSANLINREALKQKKERKKLLTIFTEI